MSDKPSILQRTRAFVDDVVLEVKKSSWPERKTLMQHTVIVIISVFLMGVFVGISDKLLATLLQLLVPES